MSEIEEYVFEKEKILGINKLNYEFFQGAIKRFGYLSDLNEDQMKEISKQINLEMDEIKNNELSVFKIYYKHNNFTYDEETKLYNVRNLL